MNSLVRKALGIALESARLDVISRVYEQTKDTDLLSYVMEAVLDGGFTLSFRNKVGLSQRETYFCGSRVFAYRYCTTFYHSFLPRRPMLLTFIPSPAYMSPSHYHP